MATYTIIGTILGELLAALSVKYGVPFTLRFKDKSVIFIKENAIWSLALRLFALLLFIAGLMVFRPVGIEPEGYSNEGAAVIGAIWVFLATVGVLPSVLLRKFGWMKRLPSDGDERSLGKRFLDTVRRLWEL